MFKIAVLVSGGGTDLQSIIDSVENGEMNCSIEMVISSKEGVFAIDRANKHGIKSHVVSRKEYGNKQSDKILELVKERDVDLIVYISHVGCHSPMGFPGLSGEKCDPFYRFILTHGKEKSIGISLGYAFMYYNYYLGCPAFINTYGSAPTLIEECVNGIYGEFEFNTDLTCPIKPEF